MATAKATGQQDGIHAAATAPGLRPVLDNLTSRKPTIVDDVTEQLAYRIAAGIYEPGELLPSVRQLAAEFNTSTPSANNALGRLAALGFAEARRGLGYIVRDIHLYGGIDTWRYTVRFAHRIPDRAAKLFADIVDIDHMLLMQAVRTFAAAPRRYDISQAIRALHRMELLVQDEHAELNDVMAAELHMLRCAFAALDQPGVLSLFNTVGDVLVTLPEAAAAFYGPLEPAGHVLLGQKLVEFWNSGGDQDFDDLSLVESLTRAYHDQVVEIFRELISAAAQRADET
ncbi:GntR family transcriptional regulator [Nocardia cyriacigeorgica]|uniref:GntR family transcriptional regulator n=1 Tax=Nocardia cyriacigeorgica TaxID=135487 RepID=A0A5R8P5W2_9NOCA|nr:GntR family transcriptional regulator [Nocardia cyriacigeorgica]TLF94963.1 GntR family transcriptional regulator [Nocardia cyriacigeorgica]